MRSAASVLLLTLGAFLAGAPCVSADTITLRDVPQVLGYNQPGQITVEGIANSKMSLPQPHSYIVTVGEGRDPCPATLAEDQTRSHREFFVPDGQFSIPYMISATVQTGIYYLCAFLDGQISAMPPRFGTTAVAGAQYLVGTDPKAGPPGFDAAPPQPPPAVDPPAVAPLPASVPPNVSREPVIKPLTRAQKLKVAIAKCKTQYKGTSKKRKTKRAACINAANKRYGRKP